MRRADIGATEYTAATVAMRLRFFFSPLARRFVSLFDALCAAMRVGSRKSRGNMTTPLPSALIARIERSGVPATGVRCA